MRSPIKFQTPRTILSSKTKVSVEVPQHIWEVPQHIWVVKSNNRVKPNNLVEVRLSCGCVGVLTISLWRRKNDFGRVNPGGW